MERTSETAFVVKVGVRVGPVNAPFTGKVTLSDLDPPNRYKITGEGEGGVAGFGRAEAAIRRKMSRVARH